MGQCSPAERSVHGSAKKVNSYQFGGLTLSRIDNPEVDLVAHPVTVAEQTDQYRI
jgi:hypothetical protein